MQIYARDENRLISPSEAEKKESYACPECGSSVRLRAGAVRSPHFFHLKKSSRCRLASKGLPHLLLQRHLVSLLEGAEMEKPFPEIGRIADVATRECIYEIQVSPMSLQEAKERTLDYESLGLTVVWILHENTYNKRRLRPPEQFLRTRTCYFTNFDAKGQGFVYDQLEEIRGKRRLLRSHPSRVNLKTQRPLPSFKWPEPLQLRSQTWRIYHEGDLFDSALQGTTLPKRGRQRYASRIREGYLGLLHILLSKSAR